MSGAHELVAVALMPAVEDFLCFELEMMMLLFQIYIVASFLSAVRLSELVDVLNSGEVCLSVFTNSLSATNILVLGDNIGAATSVVKNCAVAHILILPVDGTNNLYQ